jgi:AraC-like DNA-binding protein/mannose-6-phosphate isomerase-like protein (cupin superfamily)
MHETLDFMFERLDSRFDVLTQVLDAVHLGSAFSSRLELKAPWALHFGMVEHRAGFHVVVAGSCRMWLDGESEPVELAAGDVVVLPHGNGHTLADGPGQLALELHRVVGDVRPGERIPLPGGNGPECVILCGSYSFSAEGMNPLLKGLPALIHIPARDSSGGPLEAAVALLAAEASRAEAGTALVVDRLVDLLFVYALRAWLARQETAAAHSWFGALRDPVVGPAVWAIHDDPSRDWSVTALARCSGLSRAAFARRFNEAVGEPPLNYVTRWRMTIAADLLGQGNRIAEVAHRVGYANEFAFAKAFKRMRGLPPGQHRRRHAG